MIGSQFGQRQIFHGGGIPGFVSFISRFPERRAVVIVLSNLATSAAGPTARNLAAMLFGQPYAAPQ